MKIVEMLETHPGKPMLAEEPLRAFLEAAEECAQSCTACADACLGEKNVPSLVRCIRLNLDCADICSATSRLFSRQTHGEPSVLRAQLEACAEVCRVCGAECEKHAAHHAHCRVCAESCRQTEDLARQLLREFHG